MSDVPTISVIIPAYNSAGYLTAAIESALHQTLKPLEVIVVDDGSTDGTDKVAGAFGEKIRFVRQPNGGPAVARNTGLQLARGEWIGFLDADDVWFPDKLQRQVEWLQSNPDVGLLSGTVTTFATPNPPPFPPAASPSLTAQRISFELLFMRNQLTTSCVLARKQVLLEAGRFDPQWRGPEDYDLWLRVALRTVVARAPQPLAYYRVQPQSLSQDAQGMRDQVLKIQQQLLERMAPRTLAWNLRRRASAFVHWQAAVIEFTNHEPVRARAALWQSWGAWPLPLGRELLPRPLARLRLWLRTFVKSLAENV